MRMNPRPSLGPQNHDCTFILIILIILIIYLNGLYRYYLKPLEALQDSEEIYFLTYICIRFHMKNIYKPK